MPFLEIQSDLNTDEVHLFCKCDYEDMGDDMLFKKSDTSAITLFPFISFHWMACTCAYRLINARYGSHEKFPTHTPKDIWWSKNPRFLSYSHFRPGRWTHLANWPRTTSLRCHKLIKINFQHQFNPFCKLLLFKHILHVYCNIRMAYCHVIDKYPNAIEEIPQVTPPRWQLGFVHGFRDQLLNKRRHRWFGWLCSGPNGVTGLATVTVDSVSVTWATIRAWQKPEDAKSSRRNMTIGRDKHVATLKDTDKTTDKVRMEKVRLAELLIVVQFCVHGGFWVFTALLKTYKFNKSIHGF